MNATFRTRWKIEGTLTTRSPLHLGTGEITERERLVVEIEGAKGDALGEIKAKTRPAEIQAVALDYDQAAYVPGRALKGVLRSWLRDVGVAAASEIESVFGTEDLVSIEERDAKKLPPAVGGKAEFWDARRASSPEASTLAQVPFWDAQRGTGVRASVAIARKTRTAADQHLVFEEFVPVGTSFAVTVSGLDLSDDELSLLLFALEGFNCEADSNADSKADSKAGLDGVPAARLGAGGVDRAGLCTWVLTGISRFGTEELKAWAEDENASTGWCALKALPRGKIDQRRANAAERWEAKPRAGVALEVAVAFDGPFLVAAPSPRKSENEKDERSGEPDRVPVTDAAGKPLLPASALRGALRSRAEKILRTLGIYACDPSEAATRCKPIDHSSEVETLCLTCRLFGAAGWGALVEISDFSCSNEPKELVHEHVAIDRFTGGVSGSLKFNERAFVDPQFTGTIRLDLSRRVKTGRYDETTKSPVEPWMVGLLALVLRDLVDGDVTLGAGSSEGYGRCSASVKLARGWGLEEISAAVKGAAGFPSNFEWAGDGLADSLREAVEACVTAIREKVSQAPAPFVNASPLGKVAADATKLGSPPAPEVSGSKTFYNPYQFVPLPEMDGAGKPKTAIGWVPRTALDSLGREGSELSHVTHDRFVASGAATKDKVYSGRLTFEVKTETPIVLGGAQFQRNANGEKDENAIHTVEPFELRGEPAIAGSTLRGLLASLAEAASGSALRVLANERLTFTLPGKGKGRGDAGLVHDYFPSELKPFNEARLSVSLAEQLFGFVELGPFSSQRMERQAQAVALSSRVQVSFGRLLPMTNDPYLDSEALPLQILNSPKPPSPAFYFRPIQGDGYVAKTWLNKEFYSSRGRKTYLHSRSPKSALLDGQPDADKRKLHLQARRLRDGLTFEAHLDVENLTEREMALLLYALKPTSEFRHKLGLGKPLGLGTVKVTPIRWESINRTKRYAESPLWRTSRYDPPVTDLSTLFALRDRFRGEMEPAIRQAIEIIGNRAAVLVGTRVTYPLTREQFDGQTAEHFHWFEMNDKGQALPKQHLRLIIDYLPRLEARRKSSNQ